MSFKPFRIEVLGGYARQEEHYIFGLLFTGSISAGCPDQRTLTQMDAGDVPYRKIEGHDPDDVQKIEALKSEVQESKDQVRNAEIEQAGKRWISRTL
jgi:hypothetical protein